MPRVHAIAFAAIGMFSTTVPAQPSGGPYVVARSVIGSGGDTLSGGSFRLNGTLGQPATTLLGSSGYRVYDGFWAPAAPLGDLLFSNGFDS